MNISPLGKSPELQSFECIIDEPPKITIKLKCTKIGLILQLILCIHILDSILVNVNSLF
jgi:hypothetical protein